MSHEDGLPAGSYPISAPADAELKNTEFFDHRSQRRMIRFDIELVSGGTIAILALARDFTWSKQNEAALRLYRCFARIPPPDHSNQSGTWQVVSEFSLNIAGSEGTFAGTIAVSDETVEFEFPPKEIAA